MTPPLQAGFIISGEPMAFDLNDNLRNVRNIFIDAVRKTADSATQSSKGLFLTYDIQQLCRKKEHVCRVIGERLTMLVKEGAEVALDARMSELLSQLTDRVCSIAVN